VLAHRLDRRGDLDLALVEVTETGGLDGVRDVTGLDRTEQAPLGTRLDGQATANPWGMR
jgi:hypothetical protein